MINLPKIEANIVSAYIEYVRGRFRSETYLSNRYIFILQIREWQLKRRLLKLRPTLSTRETLLTGHRNAEKFLLDINCGDRKDVIAEIEEILQSIAVEFHLEIGQIEAQHPEMAAEFAREREEYRQMWNFYVEETLESRSRA